MAFSQVFFRRVTVIENGASYSYEASTLSKCLRKVEGNSYLFNPATGREIFEMVVDEDPLRQIKDPSFPSPAFVFWIERLFSVGDLEFTLGGRIYRPVSVDFYSQVHFLLSQRRLEFPPAIYHGLQRDLQKKISRKESCHSFCTRFLFVAGLLFLASIFLFRLL